MFVNFAAIVCDQLSDPENGQVSQPDPAVVRSVAVYTCDHGFELDGASKRVCQADGTYSQQPPVCVGKLLSMLITLMVRVVYSAAIVCDQLSDPENGEVSQPDPAIVGSEAVYTCDHGFELDGVSKRVCQNDGTYSEQPPVCEGEFSNTPICMI